jgi:hypothetical protein
VVQEMVEGAEDGVAAEAYAQGRDAYVLDAGIG